jgi:hypothetical protein
MFNLFKSKDNSNTISKQIKTVKNILFILCMSVYLIEKVGKRKSKKIECKTEINRQ